MSEVERFRKLRQMVAEEINRLVDDGCEHKSYEGTWEITMCYPDAFEDPNGVGRPDQVVIELHCYVLGPARHYTWRSSTFGEALKHCEEDVTEWIKGAKNLEEET